MLLVQPRRANCIRLHCTGDALAGQQVLRSTGQYKASRAQIGELRSEGLSSMLDESSQSSKEGSNTRPLRDKKFWQHPKAQSPRFRWREFDNA